MFDDDHPTRDGTCVRDYIHVLDLANAHVLGLRALAPGGTYLAYNLGCGGDGYTVREVIDTVGRVTGAEVPVRIADRRPGIQGCSSPARMPSVGTSAGHRSSGSSTR